MSKKFNITTRKGYSFFEVSSAFQKSIRRCNEEDALYWAEELYSSNYIEYAWKRMQVIATEEIGFADPDMCTRIWTLFQQYTYLKKKNSKEGRVLFTFAVLLLVRSNKSREVDWAKLFMEHCHGRENKRIPDYALDKHTRRGKKKGRGFPHFDQEASKVEQEVEYDQTYREKVRELWAETPEGNYYDSMPHNFLEDDHPDLQAFDENGERFFMAEDKMHTNVVLHPPKGRKPRPKMEQGELEGLSDAPARPMRARDRMRRQRDKR